MAKRKKKKATAEEQQVAMITELVSILSCPQETAIHLGEQSAQIVEDLEGPYSFARLAVASWGTADGPPSEVEAIAREVMAELDRHGRAMEALLDRMDVVIDRGEDHTDLDPMVVLERIKPILQESAVKSSA